MASTTSLSTIVSIRDKYLTAITKLADEGVSSYSIGDQSFTLANVDDLWRQVEKMDKLISLKNTNRNLRARGRNRITLSNFDG